MAEPSYTLYADRPVWQRVPWWVWLVGGVLLVWKLTARRRRKDFEDYLR
ncbi:MAG: hypothetical protein H6732_11780 [Alphaproteobacteria bacterium]|nr:hypothetical protein [Alphaproteobacteria bacterium]